MCNGLIIALAIVAIAVILAVVGVILLCKYNSNFKKIILPQLARLAVVEAEKYLGSNTGKYKFSYAMNYIYGKLPALIKTFISEAELTTMIEDSVTILTNFLASGGDLSDYLTKTSDV
jgi:cytochrome b subunit of formate dehydrogenase